ncbi:MAG: ATPase, T2SS/T4P/T4SS family [Thermoanaerobacterales bacterium]|nr:ATPase, T2SS/T4P/T4SS family [Bacillota bacterium]MDI6906738.1 ATPase, T2SS/T4P/T4SS family [Thermoanaerobacterales bacterium]
MESHAKKLLGELLVEAGVITVDQLRRALEEQARNGERLGRVLVRMGFAREEDITTVLGEQLGFGQAGQLQPDDLGLLDLLPEQVVKRYRVFPLRRESDRLTVAMADPTNLMAIDDLRLLTGLEIRPVLAGEWQIDGAIKKYYGMSELEKAFREIQIVEDETLSLDQGEAANPDEPPIVRLINGIIVQAVEQGASDVHIEPGPKDVRVRFRIDGMLREAMQLPLKARASLAARVKIMAQLNIAERRLPQEGRIHIRYRGREIDLRVSLLPTIFGEKAVIRLLDRNQLVTDIARLGFAPANLEKFCRLLQAGHGMILVTGPTGSGKTTTLYAALKEICVPERNIVTVEDPVEYVLDGITQCQVRPGIGYTFAVALRALLRQDPDVIMIGEVRDSETAQIAVRAATTGHLVLSTLHTNNAVGAVVRLADMGIEPYLVASSVLGVVAQRLVRVICPRCREPYPLEAFSPERAFLGLGPDEPAMLYRGRGCGHCGQTGYRGRTAVQELLLLDRALRALITEGPPAHEIWQAARERGLISLRDDAVGKVRDGITTVSEAVRAVLIDEED